MRCRRLAAKKDEDVSQLQVKKSNLTRLLAREKNDERSLKISNAQFSFYEEFQRIGGIFGVILLIFVIGFTYYFFFSEKGKNISITLFRYLIFIPIAIRTFIVSMFYS